MADNFKTCMFGGFDRQSVVDFIEKMSRENKERVEALESELAAQTTENDGLRLKNEELTDELDLLRKLADESELVKSESQRLAGENETLRSRIAEMETENESLRSRMEEAEAENEAVRSRMEEAEAENEAVRSRMEEVEAENETLRSRVEEAEAENETQRSRVTEVEAENETLRTEYEDYQALKEHIADIEIQAQQDAEVFRASAVAELKEFIGRQRAWNEETRQRYAQLSDTMLQQLRSVESTLLGVDLSGIEAMSQELQTLEDSFEE